MKNTRIGAPREFSNITHFESVTTVSTSVVTKTLEFEPLQGYAVVIDQLRVTYRGLAGEDASTEIYGAVSVDENIAAVDPDDEDTIFSFVFSKDRTTTGIALWTASDGVHFNRGIPTTARALRLNVISDNATLSTHELNCDVEYHYEPITKAMIDARGL